MKRMVLVLTVALMMAAMIAANAMPAFAGGPCDHAGPADVQSRTCEQALDGWYWGQSHRK